MLLLYFTLLFLLQYMVYKWSSTVTEHEGDVCLPLVDIYQTCWCSWTPSPTHTQMQTPSLHSDNVNEQTLSHLSAGGSRGAPGGAADYPPSLTRLLLPLLGAVLGI